MRLLELEPQFLKRNSDTEHQYVDSLQESDGIIFLCPKCFKDNNLSSIGVHSVICWRPNVPQTTTPIPGRREFTGTGYGDLTLVAGSSSILLTSGCMAHFFTQNGSIVGC